MEEEPAGYQGDTELKFSREQSFFDRSKGVKLLIGFFFFCGLFFFLHFRDVKVEMLELDSLAPRYLVAQVDVEFVDEEATLIKKQQAVEQIGKIYRINEQQLYNRRHEFEDLFTKDQSWRDLLSEITFDEVYRKMDAFLSVLGKQRFTDTRTLAKMKEAKFPSDDVMIFAVEEGKGFVFPRPLIQKLFRKSFGTDTFNTADLFVADHFLDKTWEFEEDIPAQRQLRKYIQDKVEGIYSKISAGNRIINQGDKVTARHIAILRAMKKELQEQHNLWHPLTLFGSFIMAFLLTTICYSYLRLNQLAVLASNRRLFLLATVIIVTMALSKGTEVMLLSSTSRWMEYIRYPIFTPFAAIMLCSLMNPSIATVATGFLVVVLTMTLTFDRNGFMIVNLASGIVAILNTRTLRKRKEIFVVSFKAFLTALIASLSIGLYQMGIREHAIVADIVTSGAFMAITALMVMGLLPIFESLFKIMTDVTLMEYMDPNSELLRRLSIEAPGTYQHSMVVGNLAEAAALAIGANGLFCRVSSLFHDIGKTITPQYFTENQQPGMNIHQLLTPLESAQVIIAHVSEGVALARKAGLPEQFIDIVKEHHGTTLTMYFYQKELERMGKDPSLVDEADFRYGGPKPRSKESAIIMIADSVEAASRSLDVLSEENVESLATKIIRVKAEDGQFDECPLTFEELATVKNTLVRTICAFSHTRVKYPAQITRETSPVINA